MKFSRALAVAMTLSLLLALRAADGLPQRELDAARDACARLAALLANGLAKSLAEDGPGYALEICSHQAPAVTAFASKESGMEIRRTSLRVRNPKNAPDDWERSVLEQFETRRAAGEPVESLEQSEVVPGEGGLRVLRYMKAIPTQAMCLQCHGSEPAPDVVQALPGLYPGDKAVGFYEGDIRGAFSVRKALAELAPSASAPGTTPKTSSAKVPEAPAAAPSTQPPR